MTDRDALISNEEPASPIPPSVQSYGSIARTANETDDMNENKTTLNFLQKVGYSLGHVFNDLCAGIWFR